MTSNHDYSVAGCRTCHQYWITPDYKLKHQTSITCPLCDTRQPVKKIKKNGTWETREAAAEARSRIIANDAGEDDVYRRFVEDKGHGQYYEQQEEIEQQIEAFGGEPADDDLRPDAYDRFQHWVDVLDEKRERELKALEERAERTSEWWINAFADGDKKTSSDWDVCEDQVDRMLDEFGDVPESIDQRTGELVLDDELDDDLAENAIAAHEIDENTTATGLWSELLKQPRVQTVFTEGIRRFATGRSPTELSEKFEQYGVAYEIRAAIQNFCRGIDIEDDEQADAALRELVYSQEEPKGLLYLARRLATQHADAEQLLGTARLLAWASDEEIEPPTIVFRLDRSFEEKDRKRRETVVRLLQAIAHHCEVVVVSKPIDLRWFQKDHGLEAADFSERWTGRHFSGDLEDVVKRALDAYDEQLTPKEILRLIHTDGGGTLTYDQLESSLRVSKSAISQWVSYRDDSLTDLGLVETFRAQGNRLHVELTAAGREAIETIDVETARQRRLDELFSEVLDSSDHGRENPPAHEAPPDGDPRRKGTGLAPVGTLSRRRAFGALASSRSNAISTADHPVEKADDYRCPQIWIDPSGDRVVTSAEYCNPMQYWVSTARSLSDSRIFDYVLTEERLDSTDYDFGTMFHEHRDVLRSSRCLGHLSDRIDDVGDYADELQKARDELEKLTTRLDNGDFDDEASFRGVILRNALGLVGTIVHIMDLVDVDLVREVRLPAFSQDFDADRWDDLVRTLAVGAAIQSKYAQFSAYRQLFETRKEKLDWTIFVEDIDADDPFGELIGSFVLVGDFAYPDGEKHEQFLDDLRSELESPRALRDDAPEFNVQIDVWAFEFDREQFEEAAELVLSEKNLRPTADPVSLLCLFAATPYAAVEALDGLKPETKHPGRKIRVDEIRFALAKETFSAEHLCPWLGAAGQDLLKVLLEATEPLSVTEICDHAGRDRSTWYDYVDELEATGLILQEDGGWRLAITFRDDAERYGDDVVPSMVESQSFLMAVDEILVNVLPPDRYGDPGDPLGGVLFDLPDSPSNPWAATAGDEIGPWIHRAALVTNAARPDPEISVAMGPRIEQTALMEVAT